VADDYLPTDDEELRRMIRAEIEQRDRQRQEQTQQREAARAVSADAERRRRIYLEELRRYYQNKPGYREVIREDGEMDWVPESEVRQGERLFDEVLEDPGEAKKRLRVVVATALLIVILIAAILYLFLAEKRATIQVTCNVPGAQVILDAAPLQLFTDATIKEIPAGEHVVTVQKPGYVVIGEPIRKVTLRGSKSIVLSFTLQPEERGMDSATGGQSGRQKQGSP